MKYLAICGLIILTFFLTSCGNESTLSLITEENTIQQPPSTSETFMSNVENETMPQSTDEFIEPCNYFYPFIEDNWIRESVESFLQRSEWDEKKYKIFQSSGKLAYTTNFNEDIIIYRHPNNYDIFTGKSFGPGGYIIVSDGDLDMSADVYIGHDDVLTNLYNYDDVKFYYIATHNLLDIFSYGDYVYYIWIGDHGFYGGISRIIYDERWCYDEDFNAEVTDISYLFPSKDGVSYSTLRKAYVVDNKAYIITASHIYLFNGMELTPVFDRNIGWGTCSVTKIGDSFYIGGEGHIAECNIVTGEEYVWTKSPVK